MRRCLLLAGLCCACAQPAAAGAPPSASTVSEGHGRAQTAATAQPPALEAPETFDSVSGWRGAIRARDWKRAAELIDAAPAEQRSRPALRYARARVAVEMGEATRALELLDGLEGKLPLLRAAIVRERARAQLEAGPFDQAAAYYLQQGDAASLSRAATAFERAGRLSDALHTATRAVLAATSAKGGESTRREVEALARATRARIAAAAERAKVAIADLRWLALEAPTSPHADNADAELEKLSPSGRLTAGERYERALEFARTGARDRALSELDRLDGAPGAPVGTAKVLHAKGWAHYFSRSYSEASELLEHASKLSPELRVKDAFYAARALSRAEEDTRAIQRYSELASRHPQSAFAEESRYLVGKLEYGLGNWDAADKALSLYLSRFARGRFAREARYDLAIVNLARGQGDRAARLLAELIASETDTADRVHLRELAATAFAQAGKNAQAVAEFTAIIEEQPLSFAALASAARLAALGAPVPPPLEAPGSAAPQAPLIVEVPETARLFAELGFDADARVSLEQSAGILLDRYAPRGHEALCEAYGNIEAANPCMRLAANVVKRSALARAPSAMTLWAWRCLYPSPYAGWVSTSEAERKLPKGLIHAVMREESAFNPDAISPADAVGLMQIIPPTAERISEDLGVSYSRDMLHSPRTSIAFGSYYLRRLLDRFGHQVPLVLAAYNAGPQAVSRWLAAGEELPLDVWVAKIPYTETRRYVRRVMANLARYSYLHGGSTQLSALELSIPKGLRADATDY